MSVSSMLGGITEPGSQIVGSVIKRTPTTAIESIEVGAHNTSTPTTIALLKANQYTGASL